MMLSTDPRLELRRDLERPEVVAVLWYDTEPASLLYVAIALRQARRHVHGADLYLSLPTEVGRRSWHCTNDSTGRLILRLANLATSETGVEAMQ